MWVPRKEAKNTRQNERSLKMSLSIVTNVQSLKVQQNLTAATNTLNTAIERMTTGYKINSAKDDAAGYSIASQMEAKLSSYDVAANNAQIGLDMLTTTEENYSLIVDHLQRIRDLTEQAANGTYSDDSRAAIEAEIASRLAEIDRVAGSAEYNGMLLMDGSINDDINIQVGIDGSANSKVTLGATLFESATAQDLLGSDNTTFAGACTAADTAADQLSLLDAAIDNISTRVTNLGASQNRLESAIDSINVTTENLTSSLSTVKDADIAEESTRYLQAQILQSAATTLLSTANQTPAVALELI